MTVDTYPPPVNQLLTLGDVRHTYEWPDYLKIGLRADHIPKLIRMAVDDELHHADADTLWLWAPVHAWRALAQLHAAEAVEPLLDLLERYVDEDDYVMSELPAVFGMLGSVALPALEAFLTDRRRRLYARITAATSLERVGNSFPETRVECVTALARQVEHFEDEDPTFNAFLISALIDLDAVEAAAVMERAFAAGRVDESVAGDWDDVQVSLGLKEPEAIDRFEGDSAPFSILPVIPEDYPRQATQQEQSARKLKAKAKRRRKIAQASRRRNRKRK